MTRQHHQFYTPSPSRRSPRKISFSRLQSLQSSKNNRLLASCTRLPPIKEEKQNDDARRMSRDFYRHLGAYRNENTNNAQDEDTPIDWDESTIVALLGDNSTDKQEGDELAAIADKLKHSMKSFDPAMRHFLFNTFVPTGSRLKQLHVILEERVDISLGESLLAFNDTGKAFEALSLQDEDNIKLLVVGVKKNVDKLLTQLKSAEAERSQLWTRFEEDVNDRIGRATELLDSVPRNVDLTVSYLEKRSKELDKDDGGLEKLKSLLLKKR